MTEQLAADTVNTEGLGASYMPYLDLASVDYDRVFTSNNQKYADLCMGFEEIFDPITFEDEALKTTLAIIEKRGPGVLCYLNSLRWDKYQTSSKKDRQEAVRKWRKLLEQTFPTSFEFQSMTKQKLFLQVKDRTETLWTWVGAYLTPTPVRDTTSLASRAANLQTARLQEENEDMTRRLAEAKVATALDGDSTMQSPGAPGKDNPKTSAAETNSAKTTETKTESTGTILVDAVVKVRNGKLVVEYNGDTYSAPESVFQKNGTTTDDPAKREGTSAFPSHLNTGPVKEEETDHATSQTGLGTSGPNGTSGGGQGNTNATGSGNAGNANTGGGGTGGGGTGTGGGTGHTGANAGSGSNDSTTRDAAGGGGNGAYRGRSSAGTGSNRPPTGGTTTGSGSGGLGGGTSRFFGQQSATNVTVITVQEPTIVPFVVPENPMDREDAMKQYLRMARRDFEFHNVTDPQKMKAGLVLKGGEQIQNIEKNGYPPTEGTYAISRFDNAYEVLEKTILHHFCHEASEMFRRHRFRQLRPKPQEVVGAFHLRLEEAANKCAFPRSEQQKAILNQMIDHWPDRNINERALTENWSLKKYLEKASARQMTKMQMSEMGMRSNGPKETVDVFKVGEGECYRCGLQSHSRAECPAIGNNCFKCGTENHWASVCHKPQRRTDNRPSREYQGGARQRDTRRGERRQKWNDREKPMESRKSRPEASQKKYKDTGKGKGKKSYGKNRSEKGKEEKYGFRKKGKRFVKKVDEEDGKEESKDKASGSESSDESTDTETDTGTDTYSDSSDDGSSE